MKPTDDDWRAIQDSLDGDCPMSIVGQFQRKEISASDVLGRIAAYAEAAYERGYAVGNKAR